MAFIILLTLCVWMFSVHCFFFCVFILFLPFLFLMAHFMWIHFFSFSVSIILLFKKIFSGFTFVLNIHLQLTQVQLKWPSRTLWVVQVPYNRILSVLPFHPLQHCCHSFYLSVGFINWMHCSCSFEYTVTCLFKNKKNKRFYFSFICAFSNVFPFFMWKNFWPCHFPSFKELLCTISFRAVCTSRKFPQFFVCLWMLFPLSFLHFEDRIFLDTDF